MEDGSVYGSGGTLTVNVGSVTAGSGGISANADGGTLIVNSGSVEAGENGYGVSVWINGDEADGGATVTVDGSVTAGETGISVGSSEADRYLCYENDWNIQVNPDDPHENWWEKMRIDETGYYVLVPVDTENGIEWQKYLWYPEGHPQHEDYSEEDISNYQVFDDVFGWVDFEDVSITTESANYANISTGAVTAGDTGIQANNNGGDFDIQVNGGVTVEGPEYDVYVDDWDGTTYVYYNDADGITATNTAGTTSIAVNGDLSVSCITDGNDTPVGEGANQDRYNGNGVTIGNPDGASENAVTAVLHFPDYGEELVAAHGVET